MKAHAQLRNSRIAARITPDALAIILRAAEIEGRSISDFVVAAATETASRTIEEAGVIHLSVEAQRRFAAWLLNPLKPTPALRRAFQRRRKLLGLK